MKRVFYISNRIGGVVASALASSAVDRGFEPQSGHTHENKIGICCFTAKQAAGERAKTGWLGIKIKFVRVERHIYPRTVVSVS
jgi:hypothetical protein